MDSVPVSLIEGKIADIEQQIQHLTITRNALKEILQEQSPKLTKPNRPTKEVILEVMSKLPGKKMKWTDIWEHFSQFNTGVKPETMRLALLTMRKSDKFPIKGTGEFYYFE